MDQDTYYYSSGASSQDLTVTTGQGYAGNTGFNEEYIGSFVRHAVSGVENLVIVNAGHTSTHASAKHGNVWYVADAATAPSSVSDADLPCNNGVSITRGGVSLGGYFFVSDINGKIYNSDLNDITAWSANDFLQAERHADVGIYLGKHHDHVVYIGTRGIEFFYIVDNPPTVGGGSVLSRRQDVQHSICCYYPNSVVENGDIIYFVGTEHNGWTRLYKLEGFQLSVLSDTKLDENMREMGGTYPDITTLDSLTSAVWLTYITVADSPGLLLTNDFYWSYYLHMNSNIWGRWSYDATPTYVGGVTGGGWNNSFPLVASNNSSGGGTLARYQMTNGQICREGAADNDAMDDINGSNAPEVYMLLPRWDYGTDKKKKINWIRIVTAAVASGSSINDPCDVGIRWLDFDKVEAANAPVPPDDYTTAINVDLNIRGARLSRGGVTRERQYLLHWTTGHGPVSVVKGLEIDFDIVGQ
ncbi:MAG: hypothetical protein GY938_32690 [Ketobacter sp.]|nr:hypothetical protein [Ketobacter sp.]